MPRSADELVDLLDLERIDDDLFRGKQPDTALQRVFGGQVAAQALVAGARTVEEGRVVHSMHSYFLRPGDTAVPIVYDVERLRDGRSFGTRRVVARQHGRPIYFLTASFQVPEDGFEHADAMAEVPAPDDCPSLNELMSGSSPERREHWEREWAALDVRWAGDSRTPGSIDDPRRPAQARLWIKVNGELPADPLTHIAAFTYASDLTLLGSTLVPHGVHVASPEVQSASLDHAVWFHRPFRADSWWLYDQHSPVAVGARGLALGAIHTEAGELVATVAQEGLIRPTRPRD